MKYKYIVVVESVIRITLLMLDYSLFYRRYILIDKVTITHNFVVEINDFHFKQSQFDTTAIMMGFIQYSS